MSRHTFTGDQPHLSIVVGWDQPLETYFAQVWDGGELESGGLLLWAGTDFEAVPTIYALSELLAPFGGIPGRVLKTLEHEKNSGDGRSNRNLSNPAADHGAGRNTINKTVNKIKQFCATLFDRAPFTRGRVVGYPHDRTVSQPAKLIRAHRLGSLTLGHYQSHTTEPPDHITTAVFHISSPAGCDVERLSWSVAPITPEQLAECGGGCEWCEDSEHLVALSDSEGTILVSSVCSEAEAERVMDAAARADGRGNCTGDCSGLSLVQ